MAKERQLAPAIIETWLAAWRERDPFCDDAIRHLQALIPDDNCYVVVTLGIGTGPRSLLFRRCRRIFPVEIVQRESRPPIDLQIARRKSWLPDDVHDMIASPDTPAASRPGQLWHQTGSKGKSVFRWEGAGWTLYGTLRDDPIISKQGKQECGFMEALASAHELAGWNKGAEIIYTFDGSTWGNA